VPQIRILPRRRRARGAAVPTPRRPAEPRPATAPVTPPVAPVIAGDTVVTHSRGARRGMAVLVCAVAGLLTVVIAAPIALSSQDLVAWAGSPDGLGLSSPWDVVVFLALDAAAAACVGMVVYSAWRGETGGAFGLLVWVFAAGSAFANYRHSSRPGAPADARWFFPLMSLAGPLLLEVTVRRIRRWVQTSAGRYERPLPHFRLARWLPLIAFRETVRAMCLAITEGYSRPEDAVRAARAYRAGWRPSTAAPDITEPESLEVGESATGAELEWVPDRLPAPSVAALAGAHAGRVLTARVPEPEPEPWEPEPAPELDAAKRAHILHALDATGGDVPAALRQLADRGVIPSREYAYRLRRDVWLPGHTQSTAV
jgi:hypothetical protein